MRLDKVKKSKNFRDVSWLPKMVRQLEGLQGEKYNVPWHPDLSTDGTPEGNAYGRGILPDEKEMMRSGADLNEILFMRAMKDFGEGMTYVRNQDLDWLKQHYKNKGKKK